MTKFSTKGISTPVGILIILIFAFLIGGILIWQVSRLAKEEVKPLEEKKPEAEVKDETADWKTYRNEEYGYEVKYPSKWRIVTDGLPSYEVAFVSWGKKQYSEFIEGIPIDEAVVEIQVRADMTLNKLSELFKSSECYPNLISETEITLFGYPGKKLVCIDESFGPVYHLSYWIQKDNTTYILGIGASGRSIREDFNYTLDQMLSTFRFLE